jgi:hypothetical protein
VDEYQPDPGERIAPGEAAPETWLHPQIHVATVWWLECTVCESDGYDGRRPQFRDEADMWDAMLGEYGWTRRDDGRVLCPHHSAVADCEAAGHTMLRWHEHPIGPKLDWRYCSRCGSAFEQRRRRRDGRSSDGRRGMVSEVSGLFGEAWARRSR